MGQRFSQKRDHTPSWDFSGGEIDGMRVERRRKSIVIASAVPQLL